jgi:predicted  nucleic acid-binding Zn-ribbon protein
MTDLKRRLRRLQILRLRFDERQRRAARTLAGVLSAVVDAERLLDELQNLRQHYADLESIRSMPALTLSGIRRKLGELAQAHTEQTRQVEWLREERTRAMNLMQTLRLRVEHIDQLIAETTVASRVAVERVREQSLSPRWRH